MMRVDLEISNSHDYLSSTNSKHFVAREFWQFSDCNLTLLTQNVPGTFHVV
jgi:hypothetical protein